MEGVQTLLFHPRRFLFPVAGPASRIRILALLISGLWVVSPVWGQAPKVTGVLNGASFDNRLSPGVMATILGANLGPSPGEPHPMDLTVAVNGVPAYVEFGSFGQINAQFPVDVQPGPAVLVVKWQDLKSDPFAITLDAYAPALFTTSGSSSGPGKFVNRSRSNKPVSATNPALPGDQLVGYALGLGPTSGLAVTGKQGSGTVPALGVTVGGQPAVGFAGLATNMLGVYEVNFTLPASAHAGNQPVIVQIGGKASNTVTVPIRAVARIGTYNAGKWRLDLNGDGKKEEHPSSDRAAGLGWPDGTFVTGDWNGDGRTKIGVYAADGFWYLDYDGNGVWDGGVKDKRYQFGWPGATPVTGDWSGNKKTKIGVYFNGQWYLDYKGDGNWDRGVDDKLYNFGWPAPGVTPIVGDWNGDGKTKIGIFCNGYWYLDYDGDGAWDDGVKDKSYAFGWPGVTPVLGDWSGDGRTKIGVFSDGYWYLDYDGDGSWDGGDKDKGYAFGWAGVTPVLGDWSGDGRTKVGVFSDGYWYLDYDGNGKWDGVTTDRLYVWGHSGDLPVVGAW
jgi:uncharacterized protein (TIGR03437 family)